MLNQLLARCGLNRTEQVVFSALLERGPNLASRLSKSCGVKRPTVYAALDALVELGLVSKERRRAGTFFRAIAVDSIAKVLEGHARRKFESVSEASAALDLHLKSLPKRERWAVAGFEIGTLESPEAVYIHLEEVLHRGDFSAVFNPQDIPPDQLNGVVRRFLQNTAVSKPQIREIAVAGPTTDWYRRNIRNPNHQVKEVSNASVLADVILVGGDIVTSIYEEGSELALRIHEPHLYQTLMTVFDLLWRSL
ncbi:MAG: helix-turn-helix domain-containing protein [Bdellovibrionota bacterium]